MTGEIKHEEGGEFRFGMEGDNSMISVREKDEPV
jgi:hypothetical protein